jgi:hypothetical protein
MGNPLWLLLFRKRRPSDFWRWKAVLFAFWPGNVFCCPILWAVFAYFASADSVDGSNGLLIRLTGAALIRYIRSGTAFADGRR